MIMSVLNIISTFKTNSKVNFHFHLNNIAFHQLQITKFYIPFEETYYDLLT